MLLNEFFINEGVNDPAIFNAIFLVGGGGSGKSFVAAKLGLRAMGFVSVNSDDALLHLMKKSNLNLSMPDSEDSAREIARNSAKRITGNKLSLALDGRLGLIIEGTGYDYQKVNSIKHKLESIGYETMLVFVNTSLETAIARNENRERSVKKEIIVQKWKLAQQNLPHYTQSFARHFIINNDDENQVLGQIDNIHKIIKKFAKNPPHSRSAKEWMAWHKPVDKKPEEPNTVHEAAGVGVVAGNKKMANDPRYVMAMTKDIKPGETQRQAEKFGNKTDKLGLPPIGNPNGKISENTISEAAMSVGIQSRNPISKGARGLMAAKWKYDTIIRNSEKTNMKNALARFISRLEQNEKMDNGSINDIVQDVCYAFQIDPTDLYNEFVKKLNLTPTQYSAKINHDKKNRPKSV